MRRFTDFRFPREQWSAGDACVAAVGFAVGLLMIIGFASLLASQYPMRF